MAVISTSQAATGGGPIISYSLEVDDGAGGAFKPRYGVDWNSMATEYLVKQANMRGKTFRARYRVKNEAGWSDYSPVGTGLAAQPPGAPVAPPVFSGAASDTQIGVTIPRSEDNGGSPITAHELWIDDGALGTFQKVNSYAGTTT